ncbi:TrbM/KikA/MpfK family conjugal transfer protein [Pasteurella atlantica]|uniref:TrbM/KikA/MpfK family conjugal transfer protein n=1 Tax=Phocoenobacter atlanticus TaxID=3416742 RepID=UPI0027782B50|nr:TrbM/KikA/MpfK family conjugal transfer protein [Pasteurella atlantica]MDP8042526.1 TrbM/KikA/MpfK family conjugal transfer protein [Pasteurella atlantica]
MKFKRLILPFLMVAGLNNANAIEIKELTGDTRLSCEAILCLASGTRPSECSPSIKRYFSIHARKPGDLIRKRLSFLNLCPRNHNDDEKKALAQIGIDTNEQKKGMDSLTSVIVKLPHECTPEALNSDIEYKTEKSCDGGRDCTYYYYHRINPRMPKSCVNLVNHQWTRLELPTYYGSSAWISGRYATNLTPRWFFKEELAKFKIEEAKRKEQEARKNSYRW